MPAHPIAPLRPRPAPPAASAQYPDPNLGTLGVNPATPSALPGASTGYGGIVGTTTTPGAARCCWRAGGQPPCRMQVAQQRRRAPRAPAPATAGLPGGRGHRRNGGCMHTHPMAPHPPGPGSLQAWGAAPRTTWASALTAGRVQAWVQVRGPAAGPLRPTATAVQPALAPGPCSPTVLAVLGAALAGSMCPVALVAARAAMLAHGLSASQGQIRMAGCLDHCIPSPAPPPPHTPTPAP